MGDLAELGSHGVVVSLPANRPIDLGRTDDVWLVLVGHLDVFATVGERAHERRHVARIGAGSLVSSVPSHSDEVTLVARGDLRTSALKLTRETWQKLLVERAPVLARAVDAWIAALTDAIARGTVAPSAAAAIVPGSHEIAKDSLWRPDRAVLWLRTDSKRLRLLGREEPPLPTGVFFPLASSAWVSADEDVDIDVRTTDEVLAAGSGSLGDFHDVLLRCLTRARNEAVADRERRVAHRRRLEDDRIAGTIERLSRSLELSETPPSEEIISDGDLLSALVRIGNALGVRVQPKPDPVDGREDLQTLEGITETSGLRVRRVQLAGAWWTKEATPLLAYFREGNRPVALLPGRKGRWTLDDGVPVVVTSEIARALRSSAWTFQKTLPDGAIGVRDVSKFAFAAVRGELALALVLGFGGGVLSVVPVVLIGVLFDVTIPAANRSQIVLIACAIAAAGLTATAFQWARDAAIRRLEGRIDVSLESAIWDRLLRMPVPFFRRFDAGELAMRALAISNTRRALPSSLLSAAVSALMSSVSVVVLFHYDTRWALVAVAVLVLAIAVTAMAVVRSLKGYRAVAEVQGRLSGLVLELLSAITKIRVAGAESRAFVRWGHLFARQRHLRTKVRRTQDLHVTFASVYPIAALVVLFYVVGTERVTGDSSTAEFLAFLAAFGLLVGATFELGSVLVSSSAVVPLLERLTPILSTPIEVRRAASADPGVLTGKIEVSHVSFRYRPDTPPILDDVSLDVAAGEFIALVGPSGCGKSTLLRLLLGFESAHAGAVYYDGHDLATLDLRSVRKQIGTVLQGSRLFAGTIFDNITASRPCSIEEAHDAASLAAIDDDIRAMPMGMHTIIGAGGGTLSGGQRQRILIARALVQRPRLLFFDEATSALDNETQAVVTRTLERLRVTRVVIAHRLSTIREADRIYVFERGRIVQKGTFEELMRAPGLFAELARRQLA